MNLLKNKLTVLILVVVLVGLLVGFAESQEKTTIKKEYATDSIEHALNIIKVCLNDGCDYVSITHNKDESSRKFWHIKKYEITTLRFER